MMWAWWAAYQALPPAWAYVVNLGALSAVFLLGVLVARR